MTVPVIPTVDLSNDSHEQQAAAIRQALQSVGFFVVKGAGIHAALIREIFEDGKTFFGMPMTEKEKYQAGKSGAGYTKLLTQALGEGKRDHKETFSWGKHSATIGQPVPPPYSDDKAKLDAMNEFYSVCHQVSHRLLEMFAMALDLPPEHFRQSHSFGLNTAFSQIHYPALSREEQKALSDLDIRAGSHRDWGSLTMQPGGAPGLQVYLPSTPIPPTPLPETPSVPPITGYDENLPGWQWYDAPVPDDPSCFLVNVGLAMELWSSGVYKATMHRVIFPTLPEGSDSKVEQDGEEDLNGGGVGLGDRYSLAYFVQPDDDVPLNPVLSGGRIDTSSKAITSGELFAFKLQESMTRTAKMKAATIAA